MPAEACKNYMLPVQLLHVSGLDVRTRWTRRPLRRKAGQPARNPFRSASSISCIELGVTRRLTWSWALKAA